MIRKNVSDRPLYREILRDAFSAAWREKRLWPLAVLAAILQTGGIYDVALFTLRSMTHEGRALSLAIPWRTWLATGWTLDFSTTINAWASWGWIANVIFGILFVTILLCVSVIAQGALVAGLGGRIRGRVMSFWACCRIGADSFWPIAVLNIGVLGGLWCIRFLGLLILSSFYQSGAFVFGLLYAVMVVILLIAVVIFTSIHLFALNAIILQGATLRQAVDRGWQMLGQVWFTVLETAAFLFVFGVACFFASVILFLVMGLPLFLFMLSALALQSLIMLWIGIVLCWLLLMVIMFLSGMFALTFQYAVWVRLYRRAGEGGAVAKLHRWVHWLTGDYHGTGL